MNGNSSKENETTLTVLNGWFQNSSDVTRTSKSYKGKTDPLLLEFLYCSNLVDTNFINDTILPRISDAITAAEGKLNIDQMNNLLGISSFKKSENVKFEIEQKLFSGELVILNVDSGELYCIPISNVPKRGPEEPTTQASIQGPRDGFVENIDDNMALIRQRLKTSSFKSIEYTIGERSKTKVLLLYIEDILNPSILAEAQKRLEAFKVDILGSSNQLEEMLYDHSFSIFPLMDSIGRPDYVVESLIQGRFAVLVDGNPTCLIGPTNIVQLTYSPEDLNSSMFYISFVRLLRITAFFATTLLPGFYTALVTFHVEQIPYSMLATIATSRIGVPLPAFVEIFIIVGLFELFKEAALRLPQAIGQTISVLGALIIGDAAIRAGLTSPSMLVLISISVISGFTFVNQNLAGNIVLLRYFVLIFSAALGLYGFIISFFFILTYMVSLKSFGQPYVTALAYPNWSNLLRTMIKLPYKLLKKRSLAYQPTDPTRQKE